MKRVDSEQLQRVANAAGKHLDEARKQLETLLEVLTPDERKRALKPPDEFLNAALKLARAAEDHPMIAASTAYDPKAVREDLKNVQLIAPIAQKAQDVAQLLADARLLWLSEAYRPSLQVYGVAKVIARQNGQVQKLVEPLGEVFGTGHERRKK